MKQEKNNTFLCNESHLSCVNYDKSDYPFVELITLHPGDELERILDESAIIYVRQGVLTVSCGREEKYDVSEGRLFILSLGTNARFYTKEGCSFLIWRMRSSIRLCESVSLESLYTSDFSQEGSIVSLEANRFIRQFFGHFILVFSEGLHCIRYIDIKLNELLMLMYSFYPKYLLAAFFFPLLSSNASFKRMMLEHYNKARSVKNLASQANFSSSGFYLHFKKIIGKSPLTWMNEEKVKQVRMELRSTNKPIKQIWQELGFSSASYFHRFCRKHLGDTPAGIRKNLQNDATPFVNK